MFSKVYKNILFSFFSILYFVCNPIVSYSELATPSVYIVTVNSMDLCEDAACTKYTRIGAVSKSFDIASVAASGDVGTYVEEIALEVGKSYTHARWNLNRAMTLKGTVTVGGQSCATSTNGTAGAEQVSAHNAITQTEGNLSVFMVDVGYMADANSPIASDYTSTGVQLVSDDFPSATTFDYIKKLTSTYTVTEEIPEISMSFDVTNNLGAGRASSNSNGIVAGECFYWVEDPSPTITIK